MALPQDLLDQAVRLLSHEKKRPKQASLRRSVSTAYYALFHLLTSEAVGRMAPSVPNDIGFLMRRAFEHGSMKKICRSFAGGSLPQNIQHFQTGQIEPDLRKVAKIFVALQEARHIADYDLVHTFTKQEATDRVNEAKDAFATWKVIKKLPNTALLLIALALPKMIDRER
jgi:uncharacterized protein (UPF0332 family)